jgi:hypothetical protein
VSGDREEPGQSSEVGSVAEEAAKLLGALSEWARDAAHDASQAVDQHLATGAAECTVCPICRTMHAIRGLSPEVKAQLTSAATSLIHAAAGMMATAGSDRADRSGVEHIDLDDADDAGDWPEDTDPEEGDR